MKTNQMMQKYTVNVAALSLFIAATAFADGIPEPGLVLYGTVRNISGGANIRQTFGTLLWTFPKPSGGAVTVSAVLTNINDQFCYVARVPFETVPSGFTATPNALQVSNTVVTYSRSAKVDGNAATLVAPAAGTFDFGPADRGRMERVDLTVTYALPDTDADGMPDAWETQYFGNLARNGQGDFDGDGVKDKDEFKAGTDPKNAQSLFKFVNIVKDPAGGATVTWSSQPDKRYTLERSFDITTGFGPIQSNIVAISFTNTVRDAAATNPTPYFYRVRVQE